MLLVWTTFYCITEGASQLLKWEINKRSFSFYVNVRIPCKVALEGEYWLVVMPLPHNSAGLLQACVVNLNLTLQTSAQLLAHPWLNQTSGWDAYMHTDALFQWGWGYLLSRTKNINISTKTLASICVEPCMINGSYCWKIVVTKIFVIFV